MIQKKLQSGHVLGSWQFDNGIGKGIIIGAREVGYLTTEGVAMLLSDEAGAVHLIINQDKLEAIGGKIHIKNYDDPFEPCGIVGA